MNFTSWEFLLLFLPAVVVCFVLLRKAQSRQYLLIFASLYFYGVSGYQNTLVLIVSILVNYGLGASLIRLPSGSPKLQKLLFWLAVAANLACLLTFKLLALANSDGEGFRSAQDILIPLALSYVTFQQIGFVYSCYKREFETLSLRNYLFFIAFFPQLVMGPIVRFQNIDRQLAQQQLGHVDSKNLAVGLAVFSLGLAKKVVFADSLFVPVEQVFSTAQGSPVAAWDMWYAVVAFQMQLFFDFTAYGDMAIGLARMFGINLPINFDRHLRARDRMDLWRRWHITFALFMRKHVFLPLVRKAKVSIPVALTIVGLLSGIWHGLGWTFIVWGLIQTSLMLASHYRKKWYRRPPNIVGPRAIMAIAMTFVISSLSGVVFRTPTLDSLGAVISSLFNFESTKSLLDTQAWMLLAVSMLLAWTWPDTHQFFHRYWTATDLRPRGMQPKGYAQPGWIAFRLSAGWGVICALVLVICLMMLDHSSRFIYVQF